MLNPERPTPSLVIHTSSNRNARLVPYLCLLGLTFCAALTACTSAPSPHLEPYAEPVVIAPLTHLLQLGADNDPLPNHRPEHVECNDVVGWYIEQGSLEVNTGHCTYLTLSEPAAISAPKGAWLSTEIRHFDLTAAEPAEAHLALLLGDLVLWQRTIAIPSNAGIYELSLQLPRAVEVGDALGFHLHNHGQNTYMFEKLYVSQAVPVVR